MDISNIKPHTSIYELVEPGRGQGTGWFFEMLPYTDSKVQAAADRLQNKVLQKRKKRITAELKRELTITQLLASVVNWEFKNGATWKGETPEFSKEILKDILEDSNFSWILEQLDSEMVNEESFFSTE